MLFCSVCSKDLGLRNAFWFVCLLIAERKRKGVWGGFIYIGSGSYGGELMWGDFDFDDGMDGCDVAFYVCVIFQRTEKVDSC